MSEIEISHQEAIEPSDPEQGLQRQVLAYNANLMLVRHQMQKGWQGIRHSHPHDQLVYLIKGRLRFTGGIPLLNPQQATASWSRAASSIRHRPSRSRKYSMSLIPIVKTMRPCRPGVVNDAIAH